MTHRTYRRETRRERERAEINHRARRAASACGFLYAAIGECREAGLDGMADELRYRLRTLRQNGRALAELAGWTARDIDDAFGEYL